jgi:hypothetical protein
MTKLLCIFAFLFSLSAHAEDSCLSSKQQSLIDYAYQVAEEDGHKQPKYLVGVIRVESRAGEGDKFRIVKQGVGKAMSVFYGVAQLSIGAAKTAMQRFPDLWNDFNTQTDDELKARLILDDWFNIRVASKYLLLMGVNKNPDAGIAAYNVGLGGVKLINPSLHEYTLKVKRAASKRPKCDA